MKKSIEKFLEFNGKRLAVLAKNGDWWIAIKPICEALGVDYISQFKAVKDDEILSQLLSEQTIVAADNRVRKMVCLPEKFIYGWLFSIRSDSQALKGYKRQCYEVLYNHFHGALTGRMTALTKRNETENEIAELEERLHASLLKSDEYLRIQELKQQKKQITKTLLELDADLIAGQLSFNFS